MIDGEMRNRMAIKANPVRTYFCAGCRKRFTRDHVVPPRVATKPPGLPWRCRPCHANVLSCQLRKIFK